MHQSLLCFIVCLIKIAQWFEKRVHVVISLQAISSNKEWMFKAFSLGSFWYQKDPIIIYYLGPYVRPTCGLCAETTGLHKAHMIKSNQPFWWHLTYIVVYGHSTEQLCLINTNVSRNTKCETAYWSCSPYGINLLIWNMFKTKLTTFQKTQSINDDVTWLVRKNLPWGHRLCGLAAGWLSQKFIRWYFEWILTTKVSSWNL